MFKPPAVNDGRGVGKAHKNRHPRRGSRCGWLSKIPDIMERIEAVHQQWFDRRDIEILFDLRRKAAGKIMQMVGPAAGLAEIMGTGTGVQDRLVARKDLLIFLNRVKNSDDFFNERARRENLEQKLVEAGKYLKARKVVIRPIPGVETMADLPAGVKLQPGLLQIEFYGAEDLLKHLFALATAMSNDWGRYEKLCEEECRGQQNP